jgi:hypothetical protein
MSGLRDWRPEDAARWLAEAMESGSPLAPLPAEIAPRDPGEGEAVAAAVLEDLGLTPCGVRLLLRPDAPPLAGPMLEGRLVAPGRMVPVAALRHPAVTAAVIGVLAEDLPEDSNGLPAFAALHAALDVSATRFAADPAEDPLLAADLARLGLVVAGRRKAVAPQPWPVSLGAKGGRRQAAIRDLPAAFAMAAAAARRLGGLPAGALLVVAGLTPPMAPAGCLSAAFGPLGRVEASFA